MLSFGFIATNFRKKIWFPEFIWEKSPDFSIGIRGFFFQLYGIKNLAKEEKLFEFTIEKKISKDFLIFLAANKLIQTTDWNATRIVNVT